ncbi:MULTISPECIES: FHA domain-containing protein [Nostoc]|uniref:FHA domain-containing protein n=1 Tax=Nostoc paludosum FACHB-159 TaxID=2692908 RepID=A0ABR8KF68_9NOSO|nr:MULTISPECIES: FHA domain-containing protein [Nostoc]MBD2680964.1 FHA domain-containing protein [Nostoc sp. FACHB-857]MBD2737489.1 FHA domain-containing protein [Nostoc paludosum FACHB-159]
MKVKVSYSPTLSEINEVDLTIDTTTRGEWIVGRSPTSDLVLDSPDVSRQHAKFFVKSGTYYFSDLGSRNGSIVNGKQAEKERPYLLNDGDVIRIADYVLIMEALAPLSEQLPETVFRIIDPSLFSRSRSPENASTPNVASPAPEVVSEVPTPISNEVETPEINAASSEINEISEVASTQTNDDIPGVEATSPENIAQPPEAVSEVPHDVRNDIVDLRTLVVEEHTLNLDDVEFPEAREAEPDEAIAAPQDVIEAPEEQITPAETTHDEVTDFESALAAEATFVQRREIENAIPQATEERDAELEAALEAEVTFVQPRDIADANVFVDTPERDAEFEAALEAEVTFVQPRDIFNRVSQENAVPEVTQEEIVDLDTLIATEDTADVDQVASDVIPETSEVREYVDIQHHDTSSQAIEETAEELVYLDTEIVSIDFADADRVEADETVSEVPEGLKALDDNVPEVPEGLKALNDNVPEVFSNQYVDLTDTTTQEVNVNEVSSSEEMQSLELVENEAPEIISQTVEEVSEVEASESEEISEEIVSESEEISSEVEASESEEIAEEIVSEPAKAIAQRNIVLIAHESKKSELAELVTQHQEFFSQSYTITWPSISEVLHQQAGITISQQTPAPTSGGFQTIASLVGSGEIVAVIFLRDLLQPQPGQANEEALLRLCTINQVLLATNVATAKAIVHYLKQVVD